MGWLFAVALGMQEAKRSAVWRILTRQHPPFWPLVNMRNGGHNDDTGMRVLTGASLCGFSASEK